MDYSARGDFPSIAVSINRQTSTIHYPPPTIYHLQSTIHHTPSKIQNPLPTSLWENLLFSRLDWVSMRGSDQSRHLATLFLWRGACLVQNSTFCRQLLWILWIQGTWFCRCHCWSFPCILLQRGGEWVTNNLVQINVYSFWPFCYKGLSIYYVIRDGGGSSQFITILHRGGSWKFITILQF